MKIFVSVGTHAQQFNRLLKEMDLLLGEKKINAEVFAQAGNSDYEPKNFAFKKFLDEKEFVEKFGWADIVISHGGAGTIINAMLNKKRLVIVPRMKKFGEHTNDHQLDLAEALEKEGRALAVFEIKELGTKIREAEKFSPKIASDKEGLVNAIKEFLEKKK
ncbi:MAG: glycosyltransferase [Candidatus ainarchaeum sp.]|nr:glycosyltransferase [Candidatus ainarchaeum sp.]